ncbi:hypothetical protein [uncultured Draconibacterium sp.]|uniref:hypothetical protein n=1 Tax=uncultured Draconibacterium sp. TaxID=1573823 RepID=UPI0029C8E9DB|nr:hypothetical protein [uncultured Draconibacterium sp.]
MFTVGIFTTHIPYLVFIACYAWFLLFGVEQAQEGKIQIAEKSIQIEYHVNQTKALSVSVYHFLQPEKYDSTGIKNYNNLIIKQKWRDYFTPFVSQDCFLEGSFCRPPPAIA